MATCGLTIVEIGGGDHRINGAIQIDCVNHPWVNFVALWGVDPLPIENNFADVVFASHCLEHVPWTRTWHALEEAHRILKVGGRIELWVPDFAYYVDCYHAQGGWDDGWQGRYDNPHADFMVWLNARLFNRSGGDDPNRHCAVFDEGYLRRCLHRAGFVKLSRLDQTRTRDHGKIQLGLSAAKP